MAKNRYLKNQQHGAPGRSRRRAASLAVTALLLVGAAPVGTASAAAPAAPRADTGSAATGASATAVLASSPVGGIMGSGSVWRQDISRAPLARNSAAMTAHLTAQVDKYYGGAAFNVYQFGTSVYTVPAGQKSVDVKFSDCQGKSYTPATLYTPSKGGHFLDVPIPPDAVPAKGTDGHLTIYSPSRDQAWEFWKAVKRSDGWYACWGGRIDQVSRGHGTFQDGMGASATGLLLAAGAIRVEEAKRGAINHALSLALPEPADWKTYSWPAQRSDGWSTAAGAIPEGTRLRLDPSLDVDRLKLHPLAKTIAKAAQKYGFIVTDKSGAVSVQAESGAGVAAATRTSDAWKPIVNGPTYAVMKNFPWDKVQALPRDYGKPGTVATSPQCNI